MLCDRFINCPGSDFPIENYSAEEPDMVRFCATAFANIPVPLGFNPDCGEAGLLNGFVKACSLVSYDDALLAAQQAALAAVVGTWKTQDCEPVPRFCNEEQTCTKSCPDGSDTTFVQAAGTICAESQEAADMAAQGYACQRAQANLICLGDLADFCCLDAPYSSSITASNMPLPPVKSLWEIVAGALPVGLTFHGGSIEGSSVLISGTPTVAEIATFTVRVTTPSGAIGERTYVLGSYTIDWFGAAPAYISLPDGTVSTAYLKTMIYPASLPGTVVWSLASGTLPTGLSLNGATGAISGTPTLAGTYNFTLKVTST